jgi:hypothetical protein
VAGLEILAAILILRSAAPGQRDSSLIGAGLLGAVLQTNTTIVLAVAVVQRVAVALVNPLPSLQVSNALRRTLIFTAVSRLTTS